MKSEINWNSGDFYELAITQWLIRHLRENGIKETHFSREAGLGRNETDARTFRKIKEGKRHWSMIDLCKLAGYLDIRPSDVLARVEAFVEAEGIVIPGKTVERIIELGFSVVESPTLISTWQRKGKSFIFLDCDPDWKKASSDMIQRVTGMTSKQIFPHNPEVTDSFEQAWKLKGENKITVEYGRPVETRPEKDGSPEKAMLLTVNSRFVPPNFIVAYTEKASSSKPKDKSMSLT